MIDRWDVLSIIGVLLVAAGWWFVWPPLVLFWLGFVVLAVGVLAGWMGAR